MVLTICKRCETPKGSDAFSPAKQRPNGLKPWCKSCCSRYESERRGANADAFRAYDRARRSGDLERRLETERRAAQKRRQKDGYREDSRRRGLQCELRRHRTRGRVIQCRRCGVLFCPLFGRGTAALASCSPQCQAELKAVNNRKKAHVYKARRRGAMVESFDPLAILERDGWRCQICGIDTPKRLRGTFAPNAPEVDHVIALSLGGAHAAWNAQCACRRCNVRKSNGRPVGQIGLFTSLGLD